MNITNEDWQDELYAAKHDFFVEDPTVLSVLRKYEERSNEGIREYGVSMRDNNTKDILGWLSELQTELMDASLYIEKLMEKLNES